VNNTPTLFGLRLREKHHEHGDIWTLRFEPETPTAFSSGQYVHLKALDPALEKSVRHMSLASAPGDDLLQFTMHMRPESPFKQSLLRLVPGESAALFKVKGDFTLPEDQTRPLVLIANGVGVTPYRAMLRELASSRIERPVTLIHVDRGPHLFAAELSGLPGRQLRIGRHELNESLVWPVTENPTALFYAAGSTSFVNTVRSRLLELGIAPEAIKLDDFKAYDELDALASIGTS
jgi:ferredoxin-NADP reductase